MSDTQSDPKLMAYSLLITANARLNSRLATVIDEAGGMSLDVYDVLVTLEDADEHRLRLSELADRVVLSRSGLTRRLDRLEAAGLVQREGCEIDRRGSFAVLTAEGLAAREKAWPAYREAIRTHFGDRITEGEARQLGAVMKRVLESLDRP